MSHRAGRGHGLWAQISKYLLCTKSDQKWKLLFEIRINLYWALIVCWDSLIPFNILRQWSKSCYCYFIEEGNVDIERISCPKSQSQELPVFPGRRLRAQGSGCRTTQLPLWSPSGASVLLCSPRTTEHWLGLSSLCFWEGVSSKLASAPHQPPTD